jgi:hypothetical protein
MKKLRLKSSVSPRDAELVDALQRGAAAFQSIATALAPSKGKKRPSPDMGLKAVAKHAPDIVDAISVAISKNPARVHDAMRSVRHWVLTWAAWLGAGVQWSDEPDKDLQVQFRIDKERHHDGIINRAERMLEALAFYLRCTNRERLYVRIDDPDIQPFIETEAVERLRVELRTIKHGWIPSAGILKNPVPSQVNLVGEARRLAFIIELWSLMEAGEGAPADRCAFMAKFAWNIRRGADPLDVPPRGRIRLEESLLEHASVRLQRHLKGYRGPCMCDQCAARKRRQTPWPKMVVDDPVSRLKEKAGV